MSCNGTIEVKVKDESQRTPGKEVWQKNASKRVQVARPGETCAEQKEMNEYH